MQPLRGVGYLVPIYICSGIPTLLLYLTPTQPTGTTTGKILLPRFSRKPKAQPEKSDYDHCISSGICTRTFQCVQAVDHRMRERAVIFWPSQGIDNPTDRSYRKNYNKPLESIGQPGMQDSRISFSIPTFNNGSSTRSCTKSSRPNRVSPNMSTRGTICPSSLDPRDTFGN